MLVVSSYDEELREKNAKPSKDPLIANYLLDVRPSCLLIAHSLAPPALHAPLTLPAPAAAAPKLCNLSPIR